MRWGQPGQDGPSVAVGGQLLELGTENGTVYTTTSGPSRALSGVSALGDEGVGREGGLGGSATVMSAVAAREASSLS